MAICLKFRIYEEDGMYYQFSKNIGADQLCGYHAADLRLYFFAYAKRFSYDGAQNIKCVLMYAVSVNPQVNSNSKTKTYP